MNPYNHGGRGWLKGIEVDLSASINGYALPDSLLQAAKNAAGYMDRYPDIEYMELRKAISRYEGVEASHILCGNGGSELFTAIYNGLKPRRVGLIEPSYSGYRRAFYNCEFISYMLNEDKGFLPDEGFLTFLKREEMDMLILGDPNNPTGSLIPPEIMEEALSICREKGIMVVLDQCFIDLVDADSKYDVEKYYRLENVIIVKAFTKIFRIPGGRIGYLMSCNEGVLKSIANALPEWNLSVFSEALGRECARILTETDYKENSLEFNRREKKKLEEVFKDMGFTIYPCSCNFFLTKLPDSWIKDGISGDSFSDELEKEGVMVRRCHDFSGLDRNHLRISVGSSDENERLIQIMSNMKKNYD